MTLRASVVVAGAWLIFVAGCGKGNGGTISGSSGSSTTAGISTTGGASASTSGGIAGSTTGVGASTTTGSASGGTTGRANTTGGTSAGSTGGTGRATGTTTGGANASSTGGTTGYVSGPAYMGFDAGPRAEPSIAPGCTAAQPFKAPPNAYPPCVSCRNTNDCPSGLHCNTQVDPNNFYASYQCIACKTKADCSAGQVCEFACTYQPTTPYYVCQNGCQQDCRNAGADFCNPGLCDAVAGGCLANWCATNENCVVNGLGACNFSRPVTSPPNGIGTCAACTQDAGGCGPDQVCGRSPTTGQNICQLSCLVDSGVCSGGNFCTDAGTCTPGCVTSSDCAGSYNGYSGGLICHQGQCVGCLKTADCPDFRAGCNPQYSGGVSVCGYCTTDQECQSNGSSMHCEPNRQDPGYYSNQCGCHSDNECPADAPTCIGLDRDAGFPQGSGQCGCTDTSQCVQGLLCEMRYPFGFTITTSGQSHSGGACLAGCQLVGGTDCATAGIGPPPYGYYPNGKPPPAYACNPQTGYCVPCSGDSDCYGSTSGPSIAPSCVPYPNGIEPASGEPTGGGLCGCSATPQCNDNYACWNPGLGGKCQPACTIVNGQDSCDPYRQYTDYSPPPSPFCNTWTGGCVQCLDNYGCTNVIAQSINGLNVFTTIPTPTCTPAGQCVSCVSDADCPASAPNCTVGFCGYCRTNADCYADAGFGCLNVQNDPQFYASQCMRLCVPDSNGFPSDAGNACPPYDTYCGTISFYTSYPNYISYSFCAQCRPDYQPPNGIYYGDCDATIPPGYFGSQCLQDGTCTYY
jgi:hypothetical protein